MPNYSYSLAWSREDDAYVCTCIEFPGLSALALDPQSAIREMNLALEAATESLREEGVAIPEPIEAPRFSGQFRLRLPRTLHAALVQRAEHEGVSLNALVSSTLSRAIGETQALDSTAPILGSLVERLEAAVTRAEQAMDPKRPWGPPKVAEP